MEKEARKAHQDERDERGAGDAAAGSAVGCDVPGNATPSEVAEGVARGQPEPPTAETGSGGGGGGGGGAAGSSATGSGPPAADRSTVGRDAPNIPNVVEYHLKVKPQLHGQQQIAATAAQGREMRKEPGSLSEEQRKQLTLRLSKLSVDSYVFEGSSDLPQVFQVKYLGSHDARGLWGIKNTRQPVDRMVGAARSLPAGTILPFIKLVISEDGVGLLPLGKRRPDSVSKVYPIESISYGVQDLVYSRVFCMIVVRETDDFRRVTPFECHAFVCESKHHARQITYALTAAFQIYSHHVKDNTHDPANSLAKRFAIQLKHPNELEANYTLNPEDSSS